jgi:hypothetical protein
LFAGVTVDGGGSIMFFGRLLGFWVVHCGYLLGSAVLMLPFYNHRARGFWVFLLVLVSGFVFLISFSR